MDEGNNLREKPREEEGAILIVDALGARNFSSDKSVKFIDKMYGIIEATKKKLAAKKQTGATMFEASTNYVFRFFGDSIIFALDETKLGSLNYGIIDIGAIALHLIIEGLYSNIAFRGAIGYGEYVIDETTLLGPAISDAVAWYDKADWIGVICSPKAGNVLKRRILATEREKNDGLRESASFLYLDYPVPLSEKNKRREMSTVCWPNAFAQGKNKVDFYDLFALFDVPLGTENKYDNARKYFEEAFDKSEFRRKPHSNPS